MMAEQTLTPVDRVVLFVAPAVFLAGLVAHPFVRNYMDTEVIARAISGSPDRWAIAHLIIPIGVGLVLLAALAIRCQFRNAGEQRWSSIGIGLLIVGGVLMGAVVGAEITLAAVVRSGLDVLAVLTEVETWTRPLAFGAFALFVFGWLSLAVAFHKAPILPPASKSAGDRCPDRHTRRHLHSPNHQQLRVRGRRADRVLAGRTRCHNPEFGRGCLTVSGED